MNPAPSSNIEERKTLSQESDVSNSNDPVKADRNAPDAPYALVPGPSKNEVAHPTPSGTATKQARLSHTKSDKFLFNLIKKI